MSLRFPISPRTQAEIFIQTLEEMHGHERELQKARMRRQIKAHVERFLEEFRPDPGDSGRASELTPQRRQAGQDAGQQSPKK